MLPPLLTLSTAYVLKELLLRVIELRHADQLAFEVALADWKQASANPEQHPHFLQVYANELRDLLIKANRRSKAVRQLLEQLDKADWRWLVRRELQAENWFTFQDSEPVQHVSAVEGEVEQETTAPLAVLPPPGRRD